MEKIFKLGDTVRLKSGGPLMTVDGFGSKPSFNGVGGGFNGKIKCVWFDSSDKRETAEFHQDALELDEEE